MHPAYILIPAVGLLVGPRWWASHVLKQHNRSEQDLPANAGQLARQWLDENQLQAVRVEVTDLGDHYDPESKSIRLSRDKFDRKTLTAITTAAHEVSHAVQDDNGYQPFIWRIQLSKVARTVGEVGTLFLITIPAAAWISGRPIPSRLIGPTIYTMLGSGLAAHLVALPTELDASFRKALPMLEDGYITGQQVKHVRKILIATSLTYIAASLLSVLHIWPWIGRSMALTTPLLTPPIHPQPSRITGSAKKRNTSRTSQKRQKSKTAKLVRQFGKPVIRSWLRLAR